MGSQAQDTDAAVPQLPAGYLRDPYPFFAEMRNGPGVFRGTVMDYSKTPESLRPTNAYAAVSFDAVNKVFRDGKVFNSDRKSTRLNSSHIQKSRMPSSA